MPHLALLLFYILREFSFYVSDEDLLVCGACQLTFAFHEMASFIQHKRFDCDIQYIPSSKLLSLSVLLPFGTGLRYFLIFEGPNYLSQCSMQCPQ